MTLTVGRLQSAWVASKCLPESSTITSGVSPTHQLGGSTLLTEGASGLGAVSWASSEVCAAPAGISAASKTTSNNPADLFMGNSVGSVAEREKKRRSSALPRLYLR